MYSLPSYGKGDKVPRIIPQVRLYALFGALQLQSPPAGSSWRGRPDTRATPACGMAILVLTIRPCHASLAGLVCEGHLLLDHTSGPPSLAILSTLVKPRSLSLRQA